MMPRKKIVFVIVEGASDETALGVLLGRVFDKQSVHVHITHGDITTQSGVNAQNIVARVGNVVRAFAGQTFRPSDFMGIIHLVDMDGAFVPLTCVIADVEQAKPFYTPQEIRTANKSGIEQRNACKSANLRKLLSTKCIWRVPYRAYYLSCNLDHALYGKLNTTDAEKELDASQFAKRYRNDIPGFLEFLRDPSYAVLGSYAQSWEYIQSELHSLERHTNLALCFDADEN